MIDFGYVDDSAFQVNEFDNWWKAFYLGVTEELSYNMLTPFRKKVRISLYVNVDHAHDMVTTEVETWASGSTMIIQCSCLDKEEFSATAPLL